MRHHINNEKTQAEINSTQALTNLIHLNFYLLIFYHYRKVL